MLPQVSDWKGMSLAVMGRAPAMRTYFSAGLGCCSTPLLIRTGQRLIRNCRHVAAAHTGSSGGGSMAAAAHTIRALCRSMQHAFSTRLAFLQQQAPVAITTRSASRTSGGSRGNQNGYACTAHLLRPVLLVVNDAGVDAGVEVLHEGSIANVDTAKGHQGHLGLAAAGKALALALLCTCGRQVALQVQAAKGAGSPRGGECAASAPTMVMRVEGQHGSAGR